MYDRAITSAPLRSLIGKLFTDGIAPNPSDNLQVTTGDGMTVTVKAGFAICGSCLKLEEVARTLAVQASDASYDRIDTVVLRLNTNDNARYCDLYVVQGIPSTTPVRPALTRTSTIWEIGLADIFVVKNSGAISAARITDTRYDATRCGVISSISEFDTTTIYNQVQADLAEFKAEEQSDFLVWYEQMRNQLSEDAAGSLQQQIDAMKDSILDTMEEVNANTQDNQLAGAKAVKELGEDLACYYPPRKFQSDEDALVYAVSLLETKDNIFVPFSIVDSPGCGSSYSSGFITVRWDTCSVVIFNYQSSRINVNSRSKDGKWTGWEQAAFYRELDNYLPLTGGRLSGDTSIAKENGGLSWGLQNDKKYILLHLSADGDVGFYDNSVDGEGWLGYFSAGDKVFRALKGIYAYADIVTDGLFKSFACGCTLTMGAQNKTYCHMYSDLPFFFNKDILINDSKVLTAADFVVSGSTSEAKLTINLD